MGERYEGVHPQKDIDGLFTNLMVRTEDGEMKLV